LDSEEFPQIWELTSLAESLKNDLILQEEGPKAPLKTMSLKKGSGYRCLTNLGAAFQIRLGGYTSF